jgi:hypothetical protein
LDYDQEAKYNDEIADMGMLYIVGFNENNLLAINGQNLIVILLLISIFVV